MDHLCWEPTDIVECKYSALIPARVPASKSPKLSGTPEAGTPNFNLLGQEPELGFGDTFDSLDGLCSITPLQPTRLATYATPLLGSDAQENSSHVSKTNSIQFSLMDPGESEMEMFVHALGQGIDSAARSLDSSDSVAASPKAIKEAQRIEKNRRIFGWVDGVISSATGVPEGLSASSSSSLLASSATEDSLDLICSDLLIGGSSPNNSVTQPSVSSFQLPTRGLDRISLLDLDYKGVSPGFSNSTMSSISASPTGELLLLDFGDDIQDPIPAKDSDLPLSNSEEMPPTPTPSPPASISTSLALVGDESGESTSKELQRKPTVVKVLVSAPKGAKEVSSPAMGPIISAGGGSNCEVGNAAWSRWVEENSESTHIVSIHQDTQRQSRSSQNTRKWPSSAPKKGRGTTHPNISRRAMGGPNGASSTAIRELRNKESDASRWNNYARFSGLGGSLVKGQMGPVVGCRQGHPIHAVPTPLVKPASPFTAANIAPVTWAGSGLPFEGLAFRPATLGYHNPQTVSYKRTSAFDREQKVREQFYGKRPIHPPKAFKTFPTKLDVWANQEEDFRRCSGPQGLNKVAG